MRNDGRLIFGTYTGAFNLITTTAAYNNNQWHHLVATQGADGMKLYVDGALVGTNAQTSAEGYSGYWRFGGDNLNAWPDRPTSDNFNGFIDEGAIYAKVLTPAEVAQHYQEGTGTGPANQPPTASFTSSCTDLGCTFDASASNDPDGSIDGYAWDFGDGQTGTGATPSHTYPAAGDYPVTLTVTDNDDATANSAGVVVPRPAPNAPSIIANDTFGRTLASSLGSAQTGGPWTLVGGNGNFAVDGNAAKLALPATAANPRAYLDGVSSTTADLSFSVSSDKVGTGNGTYLFASGRRVAGVGEYKVGARLLPVGRRHRADPHRRGQHRHPHHHRDHHPRPDLHAGSGAEHAGAGHRHEPDDDLRQGLERRRDRARLLAGDHHRRHREPAGRGRRGHRRLPVGHRDERPDQPDDRRPRREQPGRRPDGRVHPDLHRPDLRRRRLGFDRRFLGHRELHLELRGRRCPQHRPDGVPRVRRSGHLQHHPDRDGR